MSKQAKAVQAEAPRTYGLLAEYESPKALIEASKKVRDAGFKNWDTYTPFPVHGIDPAMGIKPTRLPWIVLCMGAIGGSLALWLQWYTNAFNYAWIVSGKPFWSIPANIPVIFELTVLLSAFGALGGMLFLNRLPHPSSPLDLNERFARSTDDRFFVVIEASDPRYDGGNTRELLESTGPTAVEVLPDDTTTSATMPKSIGYVLIIIACLAVIPFAAAAMARESMSEKTRIHLVKNMDSQAAFRPQSANPFFEDDRADRPQEVGTVAWGQLREDTVYYQGKLADGTWTPTFPNQIEVNAAAMAHGKERFGIYCAPCHGLSGQGGGLVDKRASDLAEGQWVPPTDVRQESLLKQPVGQLFNSITNGVRNMPGYGHMVPTKDRWTIVLYLRALQRALNASVEDVPADQRKNLESP